MNPSAQKVGGGLSEHADRTARGELIALEPGRVKLVGNEARVPPREGVPSRVGFGSPLELVGSTFENGVDHSAHRLAVLGIEGAADHLDFLEQGAVEGEDRLVVVDVVHAHTVDLILDLSSAAAPEVALHHARLQIDQVVQLLNR